MNSSLPCIFWLLAAILLLLGVVAIKRGRWPRRQGNTPHCPHCDYVLSGLESARCPECGTPVTPANARYGDRKLRPAWVGVGVLLIIFALAGVIAADLAGRASVTEYLPAWLLIRNLRTPASAEAAWKELERRMAAARLSDGQYSSLADAALDVAALGSASKIRDNLLEFLNFQCENGKLAPAQHKRFVDLLLQQAHSPYALEAQPAWRSLMRQHKAGKLTPDARQQLVAWGLQQQTAPAEALSPIASDILENLSREVADGRVTSDEAEQFFRNAMMYKLEVRPKVLRGTRTTYRVRNVGRAGDDTWWSSVRLKQLRLDGKPFMEGGWSSSGSGLRAGATTSSIACDVLGRHTLEAELILSVHRAPVSNWTRPGTPLWSNTVILSCPFEVVASASDDPLLAVQDQATDASVRSAIAIQRTDFPAYSNASKGYGVQVSIKRPAVDVAFEGFIRVDGKEYPLNSFAVAAGEQTSWQIDAREAPSGQRIDIILRGSEKVARETVNLHQYWKGELTFPNVKVTRK